MRTLPILLLAVGLVGCKGDDGPDQVQTRPSGTDNGTDGVVTDGGNDTGFTNPVGLPRPSTDTTGGAERCVLLFGASDRIVGSDNGNPYKDAPRTLQAWIRTNYDGRQIVAAYGRPNVELGFVIGIADGGVAMVSTLASTEVEGTTFIADDNWHHIAGAWDGTTAVIYVDGEIDGNGVLVGNTTSGSVVLGNTPDGLAQERFPFVGWVDDFKLFDVARQPADMVDLEGKVYDNNLLVWWDFELVPEDAMGPGTIVEDESDSEFDIDGTTGGEEEHPQFPDCR